MSRPDSQQLSWTMDAVNRAVNELIVERLAARGYDDIRPAHSKVFETMGEGRSVSEMAKLAQVTKQSMAELVRDLERRDYLRTDPHPGDRRAKVPRLSRKGKACVEAARDAFAEVTERWERRLGERGTRRLRANLDEIADETDRALRPA